MSNFAWYEGEVSYVSLPLGEVSSSYFEGMLLPKGLSRRQKRKRFKLKLNQNQPFEYRLTLISELRRCWDYNGG